MENKGLNFLKHLIPYLIALLAGFYLVVLITGSFMALSQYKLDLPQHFSSIITGLATHPIHYYSLYLSQKNPLTIILSVVFILYLAYFALKRSKKGKEWETADTDTHGSATWGNIRDLLSQYFSITPKNLSDSFNKSLNADTIKSLQEKGEEK